MANGRMIQNRGIRKKSTSVCMQLETIATHVFLLRSILIWCAVMVMQLYQGIRYSAQVEGVGCGEDKGGKGG